MRALFICVLFAGLLGAGAALAQSPPAAPPAPAASSAPMPQPEETDPSTVAPSHRPGADGSPQPSPTPAYRYIWVSTPSPDATPYPGPNAPQIHEIDLGDQTLVTPGEIRVRVVTNADVVSVIARTLGREINIPRQSPGLFSLAGMVPAVPRFLLGRTYDVDFVAAVADGRTSVVTLPLGLK